ncbi:CLUMA_CG020107, isoform A [Clunio marinus]|uniref:CLUMA_CG020107, isoform A n=1 Tax=Clunio marinus TaxID=568069 RepID=A0A1J1J6K4_9DIPT|nr:CLUMA_CG020107, isoform A [Clunio marinus]
MNNHLFAALLGCFIVHGMAQHDVIQFTDSQGRCWTCSPNSPCVPCSGNNNHNNNNNHVINPLVDPPPVDPSCPPPDCSILENRGILWPNADPRFFLQCVPEGGVWVPTEVPCQCGTFFDYLNQRCEFPWDWNPACAFTSIPDPLPCEDETTPTTTTEDDTTTISDTTTTTAPCVPCMPCIPCMIWWMCQPCSQSCNNGCSMG